MTAAQFTAFLVFALVTSVTPGPNTMMLTATGADVGIRRGLPHLFGVTIGFAVMLFAVASGLGTAILTDPEVMRFVRYAGVAMLLWLSWKIASARRHGEAADHRPIGFLQAVAFQWVNPKAWLICAAAVGGFLQDGGFGVLPQAALFALIFMVCGLPCGMMWLGFGSIVQRVLSSESRLRAFNVAMGLLLAGSAVLLL